MSAGRSLIEPENETCGGIMHLNCTTLYVALDKSVWQIKCNVIMTPIRFPTSIFRVMQLESGLNSNKNMIISVQWVELLPFHFVWKSGQSC